MHGAKTFLTFLAWFPASGADFSGPAALESTRTAVSFGPRPAGSPENAKEQAWIKAELRKLARAQALDDAFTADTPRGAVSMRNIVAKFPGTSGRAVAITGHFDTKLFPGRRFVGANDGGASTGLLLELARVLNSRSGGDDVYLVWFDGEEAFAQWSAEDGLYGSRHLAAKWSNDGTLARMKALINVDMIGDRDLGIVQATNSSPELLRLAWRVARDMGYGKYFLDSGSDIEDDHLPFVRLGAQALDLIDFDYGLNNAYWHTDQDTMDKLSAHSLEVAGNVVLEMIRRLAR